MRCHSPKDFFASISQFGLVVVILTCLFQDGICGGNSGSSTPEILGSLSQAIAGYIPIVKMLGNEVKHPISKSIRFQKASLFKTFLKPLTTFQNCNFKHEKAFK